MSITTLRTSLRLALGAAVVGVLAISFTAQFASGGLTGQILNSANSAASGTLLYTHSYGSNTCSSVPASGGIPVDSAFPCTGSIAPSAPTPVATTSSVSGPADSISYQGSTVAAQVTEQVSAPSCGAVTLANNAAASNPLLVRYGTSFAPNATNGPMGATARYITLDGGNPGGYETSVTQQTLPLPAATLFGTSATTGYGIWFRAAAGSAGGPLFGFGDTTSNAAGTSNDRILYLTAAGKLAFVANPTGSTVTQTTATDYRDGAWHFAYVVMKATNYLILASATVDASIYADGSATAIASATSLAGGPSADTGYWRVGQSPISGTSKYFAGSLSNFVTFDTNPAPAAPTTTQLASQTSFNTWSSAATARYPLNDAGTDTFTGTYPGGAANPCTTVNLSWGFTNPTSCGYSPNSQTAACTDPPNATLAAFANGTARTIASAAPNTTQVGTVKLNRTASYSTTFSPGLHLYAPLTFTATRGGWVNSFTWSDATSVFIA